MPTHTEVVKVWDGANGTGNGVAGIPVSASSSATGVATVDGPHTSDSNGEITFTWTEVAPGSATLTFADPNGHTATKDVTVGSNDDIATLVAALGGDAVVLTIQDARRGVTLVSGAVSQWDDARGVGRGISYTGAGGEQPPQDAISKIISFAHAQRLIGAAAVDGSTPKTLWMVLRNTGVTGGPFILVGGAARFGMLHGGADGVYAYDGTELAGPTPSLAGAFYLAFVSYNGSNLKSEAPNHAAATVAQTASLAGSLTPKIGFFDGSDFASDDVVACGVLEGTYTTGQRDALLAWAESVWGAAVTT